MIEGDNLEVLKLLQKSYAGKVKLIYIDPPYNTGKDFVYPDNFQDNIKNYLELTGQVDGGQQDHLQHRSLRPLPYRLAQHDVSAAEAGAESAPGGWGDFRLTSTIAKETASGQACDEIFGEENFVGSYLEEALRRRGRQDETFVHSPRVCSGVCPIRESWPLASTVLRLNRKLSST